VRQMTNLLAGVVGAIIGVLGVVLGAVLNGRREDPEPGAGSGRGTMAGPGGAALGGKASAAPPLIFAPVQLRTLRGLASDLIAEIRRLDRRITATATEITTAVAAASGSTLTQLHGIDTCSLARSSPESATSADSAPLRRLPPIPAPRPSRCPPVTSFATGFLGTLPLSRAGDRQLNCCLHITLFRQPLLTSCGLLRSVVGCWWSRQDELEPGAVGVGEAGELPVVGTGEAAGDGEAEAGATRVAVAGLGQAHEAVKDAIPVGDGDSGSSVGDGNLGAVRGVGEVDGDVPAGGGVAAGVVEQVGQNLTDPSWVHRCEQLLEAGALN
jgi:hypothetical protein